jgi:hypothetical protein
MREYERHGGCESRQGDAEGDQGLHWPLLAFSMI